MRDLLCKSMFFLKDAGNTENYGSVKSFSALVCKKT